MSDIKVGDLVVVVRPRTCCGNMKAIGRLFVVQSFGDFSWCECGQKQHWSVAYLDDWYRCEVSRLKRIPPLSELEGEKIKEELTA